jgi:hypothetical protein
MHSTFSSQVILLNNIMVWLHLFKFHVI